MEKRFPAQIFLILSMLFGASVQAAEREVPVSREQVTLSYAPLVRKVEPAVVNIYTSKRVQVADSPFMNDPFFGGFFGRNGLGRTQEKVVTSLGSGVLVDPKGLILTNNHVVKEGTDIRIVLSDRREFEAKTVLVDSRTDLAVLKIDAKQPLPYLEMEDADTLQVGDLVLAIGNPFGVGQTVTSGIVSALARTTVGISDFEFFIQTDAAINPGNSGGPLVNMQGKIIGINTAIYSKTGGSNGIGFATPSNMAKVLINSVRQGRKTIVRPWFGASTQNVTPEIAESMDLKTPSGVLVKSVYPDSSAEKAGLKTGDVITGVDGRSVPDEQSLRFRIATYEIGTQAALTILRRGGEQHLRITLEPPGEIPPRDTLVLEGRHPLAGASVSNLSPSLAEEVGVGQHEGVIITDVGRGSNAVQFFRTGDILISINGVAPKDTRHVEDLMDSPQRGWKLAVRRRDQVINVTITL